MLVPIASNVPDTISVPSAIPAAGGNNADAVPCVMLFVLTLNLSSVRNFQNRLTVVMAAVPAVTVLWKKDFIMLRRLILSIVLCYHNPELAFPFQKKKSVISMKQSHL